jgi:3-phenylpropionate/trans-cinnamate dioxygenase ferredoxin subunit
MIERNYRWVRIAQNVDELNFNENQLSEIDIEGKKFCVAKTRAGLKACAAKCPHAGGEMVLGKLDTKGNIVCTVHGYIFNLHNGRDTAGEGYILKIYPLKEEENGLFIGIDERILQE